MIVENDKVILDKAFEIDALKELLKTLDARRTFQNLITTINLQGLLKDDSDFRLLKILAKDCNKIFDKKITYEVLAAAHDFYCVLGDRDKILNA